MSSSKMVGTLFRDATLVGTNLSSSNMKQADFRQANLCGADLRSSTLKDADFRNANLTRADLRSSGCGGLRTNAGTTFCHTTMCNGAVRNDDCPDGVDPDDVCCTDAECPAGQHCDSGACVNCLSANACCGTDEARCEEVLCCSGFASASPFCGEPAPQFICALSPPGGRCGSDNDCAVAVCRGGVCCLEQGEFCTTAAFCCAAGADRIANRCSA